jgi:hypothetical protein
VATRFYLPASGAAPVTPAAWATGWEKTTGAVWRPCSTTKSNTALADTALVGHTVIGSDVALVGFVTAPLAAGFTTSADTISAVVRGLESNLLYNGILNIMIRVISNDGSSVIATMYSGSSSSGVSATVGAENEEFVATASTRIKNALTVSNVSGSTGNRLSIEIGARQFSTRADTVTLRFGDPTGTADFALTGDLTTDLCPWVELSANLTFTGAATGPPPADTRRSALRPLLVR